MGFAGVVQPLQLDSLGFITVIVASKQSDPTMNYISHLSAFYTRVYADTRLTPHHISLYSALFQLWNSARFENPFQVNRQELMMLSKIGSVNTYTRCLKELDAWQYVRYSPSRNISVGSRVAIITSDNSTAPATDTALRHSNKQKVNNLNIPTMAEVEDYFRAENFPAEQAALFFNYNQAKGWMMGNNRILNWQSAAINWVSKRSSFDKAMSKPRQATKTLQSVNNLFATTNKDYHEPL